MQAFDFFDKKDKTPQIYHRRSPHIRPKIITEMLINLSQLLQVGLPLTDALNTLASHQHNPQLKIALSSISQKVASGSEFHEACAQFPHVFDSLCCCLLQAGERSSCLPDTLNVILQQRNYTQHWKATLRDILRYPCIMGVVILIITTFLLHSVVPQFVSLYHNNHIAIPNSTQFLLTLSDAAPGLGLGIIALWFGLQRVGKDIIPLKYRHLLLKTIYQQIFLIRFLQTLALLLKAGIPLPQAIDQLHALAYTKQHQAQLTTAHRALVQGAAVHEAFQQASLLPNTFLSLIAIAVKANHLPQTLESIAKQNQEQLQTTIKRLTVWIEPIAMLVLGSIVGGVLLALYLPIFQLGQLF